MQMLPRWSAVGGGRRVGNRDKDTAEEVDRKTLERPPVYWNIRHFSPSEISFWEWYLSKDQEDRNPCYCAPRERNHDVGKIHFFPSFFFSFILSPSFRITLLFVSRSPLLSPLSAPPTAYPGKAVYVYGNGENVIREVGFEVSARKKDGIHVCE